MTELYARLIEFYDYQKDPVKFYFIDKMQKIVHDFNKTKDQLISEDYISRIKNSQIWDSLKFKPVKKYQKKLEKGMKLLDIRKAQRETEQILMLKSQKENLKNKKKLKKKISLFKKVQDKNTKTIENQLDSQKESIWDKLR